ncbi:TetR/AcrR family transcriptional regulator [Bacillaceae bacterium SIJ1]|uniref:TetR/AcrR family transcriptional regulator n=1 Tax=Litoribacterium kuwaitense TaxID=1398745 RepID=UPI0013EC857A|nr:TetR/AcrR family transcriptional regulator [Litoribacterium kuwaitense]NGP45634.1 TetR/AcrR family transcriptional regulator [Litoribacterium kuwaitense]
MKTNKQSNKDHVIHTAAELFMKHGYHVTSMDEVVKVSQVSKSNIYYHFKTKEKLAVGVLQWRMSQYEQQFIDIVTASHQTFHEKLEKVFDDIVNPMGAKGGCPFISLYLQAAEQSEEIRSLVSRFLHEQIPLTERLLQEAIDNRQLNNHINIQKTAKLIVSSIEGALMMAAITNDPCYIADCKDSLLFFME